MWDKPWTKEQVRSMPWIDGVGLDGGVDTLAGRWDEEKGAMFASFRTWHERTVSIRPVFKLLRAGRYGVYINGSFSGEAVVGAFGENVAVDLEVAGCESEVVLVRAK